MSSLKQIEANRRNELKSTGPTTPEGRRRSRCNAVRHGLTAETVIAALEDSEDYEAFEAAVISDYDAESAVERELVLRLASVLWRLRRATGIESALFESVTAEHGKLEPGYTPNLVGPADLPERDQLRLSAARQSDAVSANDLSFDPKNNIGDCFLRLATQPIYALNRLSRYEHVLWRQARHIVITLESLRRDNRVPKRYAGWVVWHTEQIATTAGKPPEFVVRAHVKIPDRPFAMTMSIRANTDKSLPASHLIEIKFDLPNDSIAQGIQSVPGILMNRGVGSPDMLLAGVAAKVSNDFFFLGLSASKLDPECNVSMLKDLTWLGVAIIYNNQSRAVIEIEKGQAGQESITQALAKAVPPM
jgi:hypothetical protein